MATIEIGKTCKGFNECDLRVDGCCIKNWDIHKKYSHTNNYQPGPSCPGPGTKRLVPIDAVILDPEKCTPEAVMGWLRENHELFLSPTNMLMTFLAWARGE